MGAIRDKWGFATPYLAYNPTRHDLSSGDLTISTTGKPFLVKADNTGDNTVITYEDYMLNGKTLSASLKKAISFTANQWLETPLAGIYQASASATNIDYSIL